MTRDRGARIRLVIVDDSRPFRATLVGWAAVHDDLELVAAVGSAEEALAVIWSERPDAVLIDMTLPGMSGPEAVRLLRRVGAATPVVMLTLHDTAAAREQALGAGATAFLPKHAVADRLHRMLCEIAIPTGASLEQSGGIAAGDRQQRLRIATLVTAAMSHEINNALTIAQGGLEYLHETMGPTPEIAATAAEIRGALDESRVAVQHIAAVVRDVQLLLRAERKVVRVDPRTAIERALRLARPRAGTIELVAELASVPPVWSSEAAITQIALNLVLNALAACRSWKRVGHVRVELSRERDEVVLAIHDDGPGIDTALLPELWQPLRATAGGSGLGLPVTRQLVLAIGGTIDVETRAPRGTTFCVRLPVSPEPS